MPTGVYERTNWHRQILSKAQKGRTFSKKHRENKSLAQMGEKNHQWKGGKVDRVCKHCHQMFKALPSEIGRGGAQYCSPTCAYKGEERKATLRRYAIDQWENEEYRLAHTGENNPMWKNGATNRNHWWNTSAHRGWREKILGRDRNACLFCGQKDANTAHHLISAYYFPEFKLELDNGITYCEECHSMVHVLGNNFNSVPTI